MNLLERLKKWADNSNEKPYTVGIALSGGGARGVAHAGALQLLEEEGIAPAIIAGTSAGAIVGSLYAGGCSPKDILEFFKKTELFDISYFSWGKAGLLDSQNFHELLKPHFPEDDFSVLSKKLLIVAANLVEGEMRVFDSGSIMQAVLASAAMPGLFTPIMIDGQPYVDGGIFNNLPADIIREQCHFLIGIDVNPLNKAPLEKVDDTFEVIERALELMIRKQSLKKKPICDVFISPQVIDGYGMFSMEKAGEMFDIGYEEARAHVKELKEAL